MKKADIEILEKIMGQLDGLHREITALAKKSPNDGLNPFKLTFVNATLSRANKLLGKKYVPMEGFELFDTDDVPSNSDVTFILSSYQEEIERMRADNIVSKGVRWFYKLPDGDESMRTAPPKKIKEKK